MNKASASIPVPPGVITVDTLPGIAAAAVEQIGRRVYVYEDCWTGTLLITDRRRHQRKPLGVELLLVLWPSKKRSMPPQPRPQAAPDSP